MTEQIEKPVEKRTSKLAIASIVCGITGSVVAFIEPFLFWKLFLSFMGGETPGSLFLIYLLIVIMVCMPILTFIFGAIAIVKIKRSEILKGKRLAIAGIICGCVVIVLWVSGGAFWLMPYLKGWS